MAEQREANVVIRDSITRSHHIINYTRDNWYYLKSSQYTMYTSKVNVPFYYTQLLLMSLVVDLLFLVL